MPDSGALLRCVILHNSFVTEDKNGVCIHLVMTILNKHDKCEFISQLPYNIT